MAAGNSNRLVAVILACLGTIGIAAALWLLGDRADSDPSALNREVLSNAGSGAEPEALLPGPARAQPASRADEVAQQPRVAKSERVALAADGDPISLERHVFEVLSSDERTPVAGAMLQLIGTQEDWLGVAETDEQGLAAVEWRVGEVAQLMLSHPEFVDLREDPARLEVSRVAAEEEAPGRTLTMDPTGTVRGRVVIRDGSEIEGIEVGLWNKLTGRFRGEPDLRADLDEEGEFEFVGLRPGAIALAPMVTDRAPRLESGWVVEPRQVTQATLYLDPGATLEVTVTDRGQRQPVGEVRVIVVPEVQGLAGDVERVFERVEFTDSSGEARVEGLPTGDIEVTVRTAWGAFARKDITLDVGFNRMAFEVSQPARVTGQVVDGEGQPVGNGRVALVRHGQRRDASFENIQEHWLGQAPLGGNHSLQVAAADSQGRFEFDGVPTEDSAWLIALPPESAEGELFPGHTRLRNLPAGGERNDAQVALRAGSSVRGQLRGADGLALPGVEVVLFTELTNSRREWATALTAEDGEFVFENVPAASAVLSVSVEGFRRLEERVMLNAGEVQRRDLNLVSDLIFAGRVVDPQGYAVPHAYLRLQRKRDDQSARADAFGRFEVDNLSPGEWELRAWAEGYRDIGRGELKVQLPDEAQGDYVIELAKEQVLQTATMTFEVIDATNGRLVPGLSVRGTRGAVVQFSGKQVDVLGIRPGRTSLSVRANGYSEAQLPRIDLAPGAFQDLGRVELFPAASATVAVRDPNGKIIKDVRVTLEPLSIGLGGIGMDRDEVRLRESKGVYTAARVPLGGWTLKVRKKNHASISRSVEVDSNGLTIDVQLIPRATAAK